VTGYVNRKKKKTVGKVVTEEVKFQKTHSKDEDACHRLYAFMCMVYPNLVVVGKEEP
jgi:hypothetical protein